MKIAFDLISDLHIETWDSFDWAGQATSPVCLVAGDVAKDTDVLIETLTHLGKHYQAVFYIDGNDEHKDYLNDIHDNYTSLKHQLSSIPNVVYLQDNVVIINGVALLGTNGWFTWDFDPSMSISDSQLWFKDHTLCSDHVADTITDLATNDAVYLRESIRKLQTHQDVKNIVIMTHTVPSPLFIQHDLDIVGTYRFNYLGSSLMQYVLDNDSEKKVKTWCFGHYHGDIDSTINGVRYVNNCRGRGDTKWKKSVYYPRRIEVEF